MKKLPVFILIITLVLLGVTPALANDISTPKEEVVYGLLAADGSVEQIKVVNIFETDQIIDYGDYTAILNMTDDQKILYSGQKVTATTRADRFYYEGTLRDKKLPWRFAIGFTLDGRAIEPKQLGGKSGALSMTIGVSQEQAVEPLFFEHYTVQISLSLDTALAWDIVAEQASIANAGRNKVITFTVLPAQEVELNLTATVSDFEFDSIEIAAVPLILPFDEPDSTELIEEFSALSDGLAELNDAVLSLSEGITKTDEGVAELAKGSAGYSAGLAELAGRAKDLSQGSAQIEAAFKRIEQSLKGADISLPADLIALPAGLKQLAAGLDEVAGGLSKLTAGNEEAHLALKQAISTIPQTDPNLAAIMAVAGDEQLMAFVAQDPRLLELMGTVSELVEFYKAAKTVEGTYAALEDVFSEINAGLKELTAVLGGLSIQLVEIAGEIETALEETDPEDALRPLKDGIGQLARAYKDFHSGLEKYLDGVGQAATGYDKIDKAFDTLAEGTGKLADGGRELSAGTGEMADKTADLPAQVQTQVDKMISQYDKGDFLPKSFVSRRNTKVEAVQFVMRTAPIERQDQIDPVSPAPEKLSFWQKLARLFGINA